MKHLVLKRFLYAIVGVSFLAYFILLYFGPGIRPGFIDYLKILPTVVTIDTAVAFIFIKYLWRWKLLREWLVPFPNLNGTFKGFIQTTWIDPVTNERPAPIPAILTISQSFFRISCVMRTEEMTSHSFISDFILDPDEQLNKLSYTYSSVPNQVVIERSPQHMGTVIFDIQEKPKLTLIGQYWTGRKTTGTIRMEFWTKKKITTFPTNLGQHPVSVARSHGA
jgi:hypothetical protein